MLRLHFLESRIFFFFKNNNSVGEISMRLVSSINFLAIGRRYYAISSFRKKIIPFMTFVTFLGVCLGFSLASNRSPDRIRLYHPFLVTTYNSIQKWFFSLYSSQRLKIVILSTLAFTLSFNPSLFNTDFSFLKPPLSNDPLIIHKRKEILKTDPIFRYA